ATAPGGDEIRDLKCNDAIRDVLRTVGQRPEGQARRGVRSARAICAQGSSRSELRAAGGAAMARQRDRGEAASERLTTWRTGRASADERARQEHAEFQLPAGREPRSARPACDSRYKARRHARRDQAAAAGPGRFPCDAERRAKGSMRDDGGKAHELTAQPVMIS